MKIFYFGETDPVNYLTFGDIFEVFGTRRLGDSNEFLIWNGVVDKWQWIDAMYFKPENS